MMKEAIENFPSQFSHEFEIENKEAYAATNHFLLAGMGGSALSAGLLKACFADLPVVAHRSYGLPSWFREGLVIASSYSGNTEETLDAFEEAAKKGYAQGAISTGGELLKRAEENSVPFIRLPDTDIQPRMAVGFSAKAVLTMMQRENEADQLTKLAGMLDMRAAEAEGKQCAESLFEKIPVIYTSTKNEAVAYFWKITLNETAKIPAFSNVFPELNHNEMEGFSTVSRANPFHFIFIYDPEDHPQISRRMKLTQRLYQKRGFPVTEIKLRGERFLSIFSSVLFACWAAYYLGERGGVRQEKVSAIEGFKKELYQ